MNDTEKGDGTDTSISQSQIHYERPTGLKGLYSHPITQVVMLGLICFMCPGLFNALTGLGGGGQVDATTNDRANVALNATFATAAFFAGSVNNILGARLTLLLGSCGYALYIGSYLALNIHPNAGGFVVGAGAILGICAGLLWTAQGSLMLAYPTEIQKGRFISIFWAIFNLGGVVGASVSLGTNFHSKANAVGNGTYIGFLVLTLCGTILPLLMVNPKDVIRTDGTKVTVTKQPSWKTELMRLPRAFVKDPQIILLFPMFFASNWFYTWQFTDYNGAIFNIRARALNNVVYWLSQIVGSVLVGLILDQKRFRRRIRAFVGWGVLLCLVFTVHIWTYFYQRQYTRESLAANPERIDIFDALYGGRIMAYIMCGVLDAAWQVTTYWLMGAMSNDASQLAYFVGFYKSIQSAGAVGAWAADSVKVPYMNLFISTWVLLIAGLIFVLPMIYWRVTDQTDHFVDDTSPSKEK
jgi:MFS family permease